MIHFLEGYLGGGMGKAYILKDLYAFIFFWLDDVLQYIQSSQCHASDNAKESSEKSSFGEKRSSAAGDLNAFSFESTFFKYDKGNKEDSFFIHYFWSGWLLFFMPKVKSTKKKRKKLFEINLK